MKIEKGKYYKSRDGRKWEVLKTDARSNKIIMYCYENGHLFALHQNGMFYDDKTESEFDLISEWTEPVEIPWSDYPKWCRWVAMDKDGEWCGFVSIPRQRMDGWYSMDVSFYIPEDYTPRNFTSDWTESLFERP
jgi:hypothetical protein